MAVGGCIDVLYMQVQIKVRSHEIWEYPGLTKVGEGGAGRVVTAARRAAGEGEASEDDARTSRQVGRKM